MTELKKVLSKITVSTEAIFRAKGNNDKIQDEIRKMNSDKTSIQTYL